MNHRDVSGVWTGVYDYLEGDLEPTPFTTRLTERGASLSGEIVEPNTFCPVLGPELWSTLSGSRIGGKVSFVKIYDDQETLDYEIFYEGLLMDDDTKIEGRWTTVEGPYSNSGPFVMNRSSAQASGIVRSEESEFEKTSGK